MQQLIDLIFVAKIIGPLSFQKQPWGTITSKVRLNSTLKQHNTVTNLI